MSLFIWIMVSNYSPPGLILKTDRLTDRQTDRPTDRQTNLVLDDTSRSIKRVQVLLEQLLDLSKGLAGSGASRDEHVFWVEHSSAPLPHQIQL